MSRQDVITIPPKERNRETGIPAVGAVPWGTHLCSFYDTKQDLLEILVPYFKAGLENNEFCIWVTSEVLSEKEAKQAMTKAVPDFAQYLERGQIEIIPYTEWYLKDGAFSGQRVLDAWIDKLDRATANGYDGLRLTGDTAWLGKRHWRKFTDYEEEINDVIGKYHMLAICAYSLDKCGASEIIDVLSHHQSTLTREAGKWVLIESSEHKRLQHDLSERKKELKCLYRVTNIAEKPGITLDEIYQEVVNLLPSSWQYPEITCARIAINGKEFKTENYVETEWKQSADIMVHGAKVGAVEVSYLEARPQIDEGPFLKEERLLIDAVAERLGDITERKQAGRSQEMISPAQSGRQGPLTPLQKRFARSGLEGFDEREIMELLLSLCPGGIPEPVSEKCLKVFPNIRGLLSATPQELRKAGLSPLFITYLKLLHDIPAEVLREKIMENPAYGSSLQIFDYLYYSMRDLKKEVFKVIYLNNRDRIIDIVNLFEGTTGMIYVSPRKVIEEAIEHNTAALIFVHNHPSGDPTVSKIDKRLTRDLVFVGNILQIRVLDHIIIGDNRYFSFADAGLIQQYEDDFLKIEIKRI